MHRKIDETVNPRELGHNVADSGRGANNVVQGFHDKLLEDTRNNSREMQELQEARGVDQGQTNTKELQLVNFNEDTTMITKKKFTVMDDILDKGVIINEKGQRELGMVAENHKPIFWHFKPWKMSRMWRKNWERIFMKARLLQTCNTFLN